ncbi:alpha/beta fold hydrolase [Mycolicibacterium thermoresistibile]|uniref:AB hydrolase-1 domain-containing protein n=2 Tax=Mycolicibacterium thermoresistibile TaxID=1797 RepID=G7CCM8_MYCT3|nr:alpha/beta hydrolase [Mycolicibacterium thermoresistibile]EHI14235.1 hypothetical protein KEK_03622 [Mycolicibacterium thermoresistibile ATCC 19527]MCV7187172.1 alpha/beta hydrolase [Mycolicibacterium thermoresistibile]GAT14362.1 putative uncharacterized protein [Mycolicibacterium thermoresistibile]SNW20696.1 putative hydrolase or acyltransferase of alpha/beta superfamily [Mycolicibacterium thermoresistibile]
MAKPILLVHGAFSGSWVWDQVVAELASCGVQARTVELSSRKPDGTLARDAHVVRDALKQFDQPAVLVGHSYGGAVITEASADNDHVAHLIYVCAALPQAGESVSDVLARDPDPQGDLAPALEVREDGTATMKRDAARQALFNDATEEQFESVVDKLGPHAMGTLSEPVTGLGWQQHPATYVIALRDQMFSVALQEEFASHVGTVAKIDTGHGPMATRPAELAEIIATAAR